jgi:hypothetical protein
MKMFGGEGGEWRCGWEGGRTRGETQAMEDNKKNLTKAQNVKGGERRGVGGGEGGGDRRDMREGLK